jgi:Fe-S-cluster-containing hydrogenase component 2
LSSNLFDQFFGAQKQEPLTTDQTIFVDKRRCPENHPCPSVRVCPVNALTQKGYAAPKADMKACVKCGKCVRYCPMGAIRVVSAST